MSELTYLIVGLVAGAAIMVTIQEIREGWRR